MPKPVMPQSVMPQSVMPKPEMPPSCPETNASAISFFSRSSRFNAARAGFLILAFVLVVACGESGSWNASQEPRQVEGLIVEVVDRGIDEVETLRIKDSSGKMWTFTTEGYAGVTPAHLREHQLFGDAVTVTFQEKDGPEGRILVASQIAD